MPGIGGLEATRRIHRTMEDIKVLILTAHMEDSVLRRMLEAGASGFLSKRRRRNRNDRCDPPGISWSSLRQPRDSPALGLVSLYLTKTTRLAISPIASYKLH